MSKIIFVSGVHGVGKTYLCNSLKQQYQFSHYSASQLIAKVKHKTFNQSKRVGEIKENQDFLISAIAGLNLNNEVMLLDGHFCIVNQSSEIIRLPDVTFRKLSPVGIILLMENPHIVYQRLQQRDNVSAFDLNFIGKLQEEEKKYSEEISNLLNVPLYIYSSDENNVGLDKFINTIVEL
ncbi:ATP-binding protein [Paenibacillus sp. Marseille-Q9583]